jgi:hypothetical protein
VHGVGDRGEASVRAVGLLLPADPLEHREEKIYWFKASCAEVRGFDGKVDFFAKPNQFL